MKLTDYVNFVLIFTEFWGTRHFVTFMLFLGMANAYVMRTNMSVAIVAMVNHTYIEAGSHEAVDDECAEYNQTIVVSIFHSFPCFVVKSSNSYVKKEKILFFSTKKI